MQVETTKGACFLDVDKVSIAVGKATDLVLIKRKAVQDIRHIEHVELMFQGWRR